MPLLRLLHDLLLLNEVGSLRFESPGNEDDPGGSGVAAAYS